MRHRAHNSLRGPRGARRSEHGFALLEILIAFLVLALGLGALFIGVSVAIGSDARTMQKSKAYFLAQSRLEAAGITEGLVPGYREQEIAKGYRLTESITVVDFDGQPSERGVGPGRGNPAVGAISSYWVKVSVETANGVSISLAALKLGPSRRQ